MIRYHAGAWERFNEPYKTGVWARLTQRRYSSATSISGKSSDVQNACRLGSLNCEHGFDDADSISTNTNTRIPKVKKPNACMIASPSFTV